MTYSLTVPTESELNSFKIIAKVAASNQYWRKLGGSGPEESVVATILSVMLLGRELGISPMQCVSGGINNIQGKFEISARLMNQLIRKHGHLIQVKYIDNTLCKMYGKRKDTGEEMEVTYHIEEAMRSGLVKEGSAWKKVPQDMLFARCISRLARRMFPDCIGGCYVEGELQETVLKETVTTIDVPPVQDFITPEEPIIIQLPQEIKDEYYEEIEEYLKVCANEKYSINDIKKRANANMEEFLKQFHIWKEKRMETELELSKS